MKRKWWCLAVMIGMMFMTACTRESEVAVVTSETPEVVVNEPEVSEEIEEPKTPTQQVEPQHSDTLTEQKDGYEYVYNHEVMSDWQNAYADKLNEVREANLSINEDYWKEKVESYFLYDMNYDGIPELFLFYKGYKATYHVGVFTYEQDAVKEIEVIEAEHTFFFSTPQDGLMVYWEHLENAYVSTLLLENGVLTERNIYEQKTIEEHKEADEIIDGAEYLSWRKINLDLPIVFYGQTFSNTASTLSEDEVKATLETTYQQNGDVYGVSGDDAGYFGGDTGLVDFKTYCQPGYVYDCMDCPVSVVNTQWVDVNQDGQVESVLELSGEDSYGPIYVILSLQDNVVYAYCFHFWINPVVWNEDGSLSYEHSYYDRIIFDKSQCYTIKQ